MNMQNKLYTIQFSHHLMTDLQPVRKQQSWNLKSWILKISQNSQKRLNSQKCSDSQTRENSNPGKREREVPAPWPTPICKMNNDAYGVEYFHWPAWAGCLAVISPSSCTHLLVSWIWETGKKDLDYRATTKNFGVVNILPVL